MEREILFRGKRLHKPEWAYGSLIICRDSVSIWSNYIVDDVEVDPATVGQYTGMTDRNGIKVFEGDCCVVTRSGVFARGFITFHQGCFLFEENKTGNLLRLCDMEINGYQIEVRGNIHDNHELLEVQG